MLDRQTKQAVKGLKGEILKDPTVQRFLKLEKAIKKNRRLKTLEEEIIKYKKLMSTNMADDALYFPAKAEYERLFDEYNNDPLIVNHAILAEEVKIILQQVQEILDFDS